MISFTLVIAFGVSTTGNFFAGGACGVSTLGVVLVDIFILLE
jgi:hypothetical protein